MDGIKYQLVKASYENLDEDLKKLISFLNLTPGVKAEAGIDNPNIISIRCPFGEVSYNASIEITGGKDASGEENVKQPIIILICQPIDNIIPNIVKIAASRLGYRLFSQTITSFIPRDPALLDISTEIVLPKPSGILKSRNFKPVFIFRNSNAIYAENLSDKSIHFINEYLLGYYIKFGINQNENPQEFSYKVAANLKSFVPLFDSGLVPINFYEYLQKPLKIFNYSGFDIQRPNRKIFIQPLIFDLDESKQAFSPIAPRGSAALVADKIRPGENLDTSIKRYLREQMGVSEYIGAVVHRAIEFDRDREGNLTPRLIVNVFVEKIERSEMFEEKSQRGWTSIKN